MISVGTLVFVRLCAMNTPSPFKTDDCTDQNDKMLWVIEICKFAVLISFLIVVLNSYNNKTQ